MEAFNLLVRIDQLLFFIALSLFLEIIIGIIEIYIFPDVEVTQGSSLNATSLPTGTITQNTPTSSTSSNMLALQPQVSMVT